MEMRSSSITRSGEELHGVDVMAQEARNRLVSRSWRNGVALCYWLDETAQPEAIGSTVKRPRLAFVPSRPSPVARGTQALQRFEKPTAQKVTPRRCTKASGKLNPTPLAHGGLRYRVVEPRGDEPSFGKAGGNGQSGVEPRGS